MDCTMSCDGEGGTDAEGILRSRRSGLEPAGTEAIAEPEFSFPVSASGGDAIPDPEPIPPAAGACGSLTRICGGPRSPAGGKFGSRRTAGTESAGMLYCPGPFGGPGSFLFPEPGRKRPRAAAPQTGGCPGRKPGRRDSKRAGSRKLRGNRKEGILSRVEKQEEFPTSRLKTSGFRGLSGFRVGNFLSSRREGRAGRRGVGIRENGAVVCRHRVPGPPLKSPGGSFRMESENRPGRRERGGGGAGRVRTAWQVLLLPAHPEGPAAARPGSPLRGAEECRRSCLS